MKIALGLMTKDKLELTKQILPAILHQGIDLFWFDGSMTEAAERYPYDSCAALKVYSNVKGGPDAAAAFAFTTMLAHKKNFDFVGIIENDVLLRAGNWLVRTMELFDLGAADGLKVGAVSTRAYEDRVLIQRDGYAVMHNLGFGQIIMSREAAYRALSCFRTSLTLENRRLFSQLAGIDIGSYWAFRGGVHPIGTDWGLDRNLASFGFASLALTPSPVEMIGQDPPLADQGLAIVSKEIEHLRNEQRMQLFAARTRAIRDKMWQPATSPLRYYDESASTWTIFPHQMATLDGRYEGSWTLKWAQGFGPFAWRAVENAVLSVPVSGNASFLVSGGEKGGKVELLDLASGYKADPLIQAEGPQGNVMGVTAPSGFAYRQMRLMLDPGCVFYGIQTKEPQPMFAKPAFDHSVLPPVG